MTSQQDSTQSGTQKNLLYLPSSVLIPRPVSPVHFDPVKQCSADICQDDDLRRSKVHHSPKTASKSRYKCLFCGCLPRHSNGVLEFPQASANPQLHQDELPLVGGIAQSSSSQNNTMLPVPSLDDACEDEAVSSKSNEKSQFSFPLLPPFSRLRNYIAKRRRKNCAKNSEGSISGSDSSNKDNVNGSKSANDLQEQHPTLLGPQKESDRGKKCFIIDLDETLVHSSFKAVDKADFKVGVEIDNVMHQVYVLKRPHVDEFLRAVSNIYECVLFTASLSKYADPVADFLDKWHVFRYRLFREACVYHRGNYVKDLAKLGRPIEQVVILDNSPASYMFHVTNAVQITSWFDDKSDKALLELIPYFLRLAQGDPSNVVKFLQNNPPPAEYAILGSDAAGVLLEQPSESSTVGSPFSLPTTPSVVITSLSPLGNARSSGSNPIASNTAHDNRLQNCDDVRSIHSNTTPDSSEKEPKSYKVT